MALRFEWDPTKAATNLRKHGVSFPEAATVFGDPLGGIEDDPDHSEAEDRYTLIGMSEKFRILVVVFAEQDDTIRILSSRLATPNERKQYEEREKK